MKISKIILTSLAFIYLSQIQADGPTTLENSRQLIIVTNSSPHDLHARLSYYARIQQNEKWQMVGDPIAVVVGRNGITKNKKEGDGSTPFGIHSLGTAFGFSSKADDDLKLTYLPITENTVCVDDEKSKYYNQIIESNKVEKASWESGEIMQEKMPEYKYGVVINYNLPIPKPSLGSCIFMHIWTTPDKGTAGCVAMSEQDIKKLLAWIDPNKKPFIIIASINDYKMLSRTMRLPQAVSIP